MAMDPGQRGFGQPMRRQGPVDRLDESVGERFRGLPPELLQMLMAQLMAGQGGGRPPQRPPMGGGAPQRPPMGGSRPPVVKLEDLMAAMTNRSPQGAPQANMPVPQARGRIGR